MEVKINSLRYLRYILEHCRHDQEIQDNLHNALYKYSHNATFDNFQ